MYIMISNSDGDTYVEQVDPDGLIADIENGNYGDEPIFLDALPDRTNTNYWPAGAHLLLKCEVVTPKPKEVTTRYILE